MAWPRRTWQSAKVARDGGGDPSTGLSRYLAGGFRPAVPPDSDRFACIDPSHVQVLIAAIDRDRRAETGW